MRLRRRPAATGTRAAAVGRSTPPAVRAADDVVGHVRPGPARRAGGAGLAATAAAGGAVAAWAAAGAPGPGAAHVAARAVVLVAALVTTAACAGAARRAGGGTRRGWVMFSLTAGCWTLTQCRAAAEELLTGRPLALPAPTDVTGIVAIVLPVLALLAFLGGAVSSAARMRALLDGLLIASSLLFVSWALILGDIYEEGGDGPARVLGLAYPMGDVVLVSLVLVAVMRVDHRSRLPWTLLGTGLAMFAVSHSALAYLLLGDVAGQLGLETVSWVVGCLLVGAAAVTSRAGSAPLSSEPRAGGLVGIFVPHVPLLLAGAVALTRPRDRGVPVFLLVNGAVIVVLLLVRQVIAQLENLTLARELEQRVRERTAELHRQERHFRALVKHASDVLTVVDADGIIRYQSASVTRVLGHRPEDLVGQPLDRLVPSAQAGALRAALRHAEPAPAPPSVLQVDLLRADGAVCRAETTVSNLLAEPAVRGFVLTSRDVGERAELENRLRRQALHDPLTGLGNRTLFRDRLEHAVARARRTPELLAVLMVDLDGFKQVNDTLGHEVGDHLLAEVARRLQDSVREGDTVARMGGDEFAVLLEHCDVEGPAVVAQRIVYKLRAPVDIDGKAIVTHGSVGVAMASTSSLRAEELLRNADLAMYAAKSNGKGAFEVFEPDMHTAALKRVELEADLRDALHKHQLELHYQPVVELPSGRISGAEALVRWRHAERGMVSPAEFIPLAEESGLVVDLGRWVLHEACHQARRFQDAYPSDPPFTMAVNVAARQLASQWLVEEVRKALASSGLDPSTLVLEITEGALMKDTSSILPTLSALRALGVRLAIDDFGTGWSSLSRLRSFPVDKLKIDQSFIQEITSSDDEAPLVAAIVAMAHSLRLTTVAEGVETPEQLACMHLHGCEEVQGYLLSRPLPAPALEALLADPGGLLEPAGRRAGGLTAAEEGFMDVVAETSRPADGADRVRPVLGELRRVTGADVVYLTEVDWNGPTQHVRFVSAGGSAHVQEGVGLPWPGSPCDRAVRGGPRLVEGLPSRHPDHPLVRSAGLSTLVTVPVRTPGGHIFGTLCAADAGEGRLGQSAVVLLELFAALLVEHVAPADRPEPALT